MYVAIAKKLSRLRIHIEALCKCHQLRCIEIHFKAENKEIYDESLLSSFAGFQNVFNVKSLPLIMAHRPWSHSLLLYGVSLKRGAQA